jgi:hypothetical protein
MQEKSTTKAKPLMSYARPSKPPLAKADARNSLYQPVGTIATIGVAWAQAVAQVGVAFADALKRRR